MNLRPDRIRATWHKVTFAIVAVVLIMVPMFADATVYESITQDVDFQAIGDSDEIQNNLDPGSKNNWDTWDPVPQGSWFGGWPIESRLRITDVPDDNYEIAMATVCRFSPEAIMSGTATTLVRLPMSTGDDPWDHARLNIYSIANGTDWRFSRIDAADYPPGGLGYELDKMKVNFTNGTHELAFWSTNYYPGDLSPTDGNDHFTRSNRTYAFVDAPLYPDVYYLFVTYVWYDSDKYVDIYIQPDSLDSDGIWNRSDIGRYNEDAPDSYILEFDTFNVSFGYSFDFRNGFGNSAYGLNEWFEPGDEIRYFTYADLSNDSVEDDDFISVMVPFKSTGINISFDVSIFVYNPATGGFTSIYYLPDRIYNDFILFSMDDDWGTNKSALGFTPNGWFEIKLTVNNQTRLRFPLWDLESWTGANGINQSWNGTIIGNIWESNENLSYNLLQWCQLNHAGDYYNYHWQIMNAFQFNNFRWDRTAPATSFQSERIPFKDMSWGDKILWAVGQVIIGFGTFVETFTIPGGIGTIIREFGMSISLKARSGIISQWAGYAWDAIKRIGTFFAHIGQWLWRVGQAVVGALTWFIEQIVNYATIILGILILVLSVFLAFFMFYGSAKLAMTLVAAFRFRGQEAIGHITDLANAVGKVGGR